MDDSIDVEIENETLPQAIEVEGLSPSFATVGPEDCAAIIPHEDHGIITVLGLCVESMKADSITVDREKQLPFTHADQRWHIVGNLGSH